MPSKNFVVFQQKFIFKPFSVERAKKKPMLKLPKSILKLTTMVKGFPKKEHVLMLMPPTERLSGMEMILFLRLLWLSSMPGQEPKKEILVLFLELTM